MSNLKRISLVMLLAITGCFPTHQILVTRDLSQEKIELPFKFTEINIVDTRGSLLPMNWKVPKVSAKKKEWIGNPEISQLNRNDILGVIKQSEKIDGVPAIIEFRLIEGVCQLKADWKSVTEYSNFRAELIVEIPGRNLIYKSSAEMFYENPTINGTEEGCLKMYNISVRNVTHLALKQIRDEIKF